MKILAFLSFVCLFTFNQAIIKDIPDYVCGMMVNGTKIKEPRPECTSSYYDCIDGVAIRAECPRNYLFNKDRQMCVPKAELNCPKISACNGKTTGFAPDPFSCHGYYVCSKTKETLGYCGDGMSFFDNKCWKKDECYIDVCLIAPSYKYFGTDGDDCRGWQICKGDKPEKGTCGQDMIFDRDDGTCDHELSGNCRPSTTPTDTRVGDYCDYVDFKIDSKSCTGYFYCHKNKVLRGECAAGKFFTGEVCTSRLNYNCNRGDPCEGLSKSPYTSWTWVNDPSDCRKYYHCNRDKSNGDSKFCTQNSPYFDEERQVCVAKKPSYKACHEVTE